MALQPITGIPSSFRAPITAAEILFAQGASTASQGERTAIYVMPLSAAGTWTVNEVVEVNNEGDAATGAGVGSPLHRAIRIHFQANRTNKVFALPYAETSAGAPVAADGTITIVATPTGTGTLTATIQGEEVSVSFTTVSTATTIAAALAAAINGRTHLACTAGAAVGVVTLTAKIAGTSQGDATTGVIRMRSDVETGLGVTVTDSGAALGLGTGTAGVEGSTTENANFVAALAIIDASLYYFVGSSMILTGDWTALTTHISNKSEPNPGLRSVGVVGFTGAQSTAQTSAISENFERLQVVNQPNSEHDPAELVGNTIAIRQKRENVDPSFNFDNYGRTDWLIKKVFADVDFPDLDDKNDAVTDGVTLIASDQFGSRIVMSVNTRSKDLTGANDDFRATETHRVSVMDNFVATWILRHVLSFGEFKLRDDERLPDGTVNLNARIPPRTMTPFLYRGFANRIIQEFVDAGLLQDALAWQESLNVNIDPSNSGRLEVGASGRTVDLLHQTTIRLAETNPG